jgi:hypothetical protein
MTRLTWAASVTLALCLHMTAHAAAQQQDAPLDLSNGWCVGAGLTPDASLKVRKGNYERIFDEGRRRVRAWERTQQ